MGLLGRRVYVVQPLQYGNTGLTFGGLRVFFRANSFGDKDLLRLGPPD